MLKVNEGKLKEIRFFIDPDYSNSEQSVFFKCAFDIDSTINILGKEGSYSRSHLEMDIPIEMSQESRAILIGLWYQMQDELNKEINKLQQSN